MCVVGGEGGNPDKHGALTVVFQYSFQVSRPTQWFHVTTQWLCLLMGGGGGTPDKHGALTVVFQYSF